MVKKRARLTEDNDPLTATDKVLAGFQQLSQPTSQLARNTASQKDNRSTSQQVDKSALRKVTFQIAEPIINQLEQLHLQLQLDLGKANAPYKEVIVEEAISQILATAAADREALLEALQKRQSQRR
jgi:hypothetical protein